MTLAPLLEQMVLHERLGMKPGRGFFEYGETTTGELDTRIQKLPPGTQRPDTPWAPARLLMGLINEAVIALQEGIAPARDIDLAMVAGTGFPTDKEGPLHYADSNGLDQVLESLKHFKDSLGMRFWPAHLLRRMVAAGMIGRKAGRGFCTYP